MKVTLKLEIIGDNIIQQEKLSRWQIDQISPGLSKEVFGEHLILTPPWVAEITGEDPTFKFKREFLHGQKDYSEANSIGSRGVYLYFYLESGKIYEVYEHISWRRRERYFLKVDDDGKMHPISKDEVLECIRKSI